MVREAALALLLLATATSRHHQPPLMLTAEHPNVSLTVSDITYLDTNEYYAISDKTHRYKRESHSLIGTFDISKIFKKRNRPKQVSMQSSTSPLHADERTTVEETIILAALKDNDNRSLNYYFTTELIATTNISINRENMVNKSVSLIQPNKNLTESNKTTEQINISPNKAKTKNKITRKSKSVSVNKPQLKSVVNNERTQKSVPRVTNKKKAENDSVWPVKHAAVLEGDIILGGLMMVSNINQVHFTAMVVEPVVNVL